MNVLRFLPNKYGARARADCLQGTTKGRGLGKGGTSVEPAIERFERKGNLVSTAARRPDSPKSITLRLDDRSLALAHLLAAQAGQRRCFACKRPTPKFLTILSGRGLDVALEREPSQGH